MEHHFSWLGFLTNEHFAHQYGHTVTAGLIVLFLIFATLLVCRKLRRTEERLIPGPKTTLTNIFEVAVENILGLLEGIVGPDAKKYFPLIGTIFIYIFLCNAVGLIPGVSPPTDNINTNASIALTVFIYYNVMGIKAHGLRAYLKHFMGPILWLGPLVAVIEVIGHAVRPVSLSLRLLGNITGDHLVIGIFSDLVPLLIPVVFMALGLFVSFIQAFVFSLLSTIYIGLATAHEHEAHEAREGHAH
ncbi:MAG TPA: F0F1 ATP synthase subunit A [bacterium]|nr:F0F1 ATP synthase subunit A [bacterium]